MGENDGKNTQPEFRSHHHLRVPGTHHRGIMASLDCDFTDGKIDRGLTYVENTHESIHKEEVQHLEWC